MEAPAIELLIGPAVGATTPCPLALGDLERQKTMPSAIKKRAGPLIHIATSPPGQDGAILPVSRIISTLRALDVSVITMRSTHCRGDRRRGWNPLAWGFVAASASYSGAADSDKTGGWCPMNAQEGFPA